MKPWCMNTTMLIGNPEWYMQRIIEPAKDELFDSEYQFSNFDLYQNTLTKVRRYIAVLPKPIQNREDQKLIDETTGLCSLRAIITHQDDFINQGVAINVKNPFI